MNRRTFLQSSAAALAAREALALDEQAEILKRIKVPAFPPKDFDITRHGAKPGGETLCSDAIAKAIAACTASGGGRVVIPPGVFLTGAIHLDSNVNLHVSEGATLKFSQNPEHYLPVVFTRWEALNA